MLCQIRRELEQDKQYVDELVEKYAPGSREFDYWIVESAEHSSRLDIHKAYCVFCPRGIDGRFYFKLTPGAGCC